MGKPVGYCFLRIKTCQLRFAVLSVLCALIRFPSITFESTLMMGGWGVVAHRQQSPKVERGHTRQHPALFSAHAVVSPARRLTEM